MEINKNQRNKVYIWSLGTHFEPILNRWAVFSYIEFGMLPFIVGAIYLKLDWIYISLIGMWVLLFFFSGKIVLYPDKIFIPKTLFSGELIPLRLIDTIIVKKIKRSNNSLRLPAIILFIFNSQINYLNLTNFFFDQRCKNFLEILDTIAMKNSIKVLDVEDVEGDTIKVLKKWESQHEISSKKRFGLSVMIVIIGIVAMDLMAYYNVLSKTIYSRILGETFFPLFIFFSSVIVSMLIWIADKNFNTGVEVRSIRFLAEMNNEQDE